MLVQPDGSRIELGWNRLGQLIEEKGANGGVTRVARLPVMNGMRQIACKPCICLVVASAASNITPTAR